MTYQFLRALYRTLEVPSSRIVILEGIYALSEKLRPLLDLRVSVTGGVHFDLVKRVLRDIQRAGQEPEEIIHQISETVFMLVFAIFYFLAQINHPCCHACCLELLQIWKKHETMSPTPTGCFEFFFTVKFCLCFFLQPGLSYVQGVY
jgi:hypothetical protein